jgi:uncharacterized repeat protein (TIGR03803 family)
MPAIQHFRETNKVSLCSMSRMACVAILLCFAPTISANAQTFTTLADFPFQSGSFTGGPALVQGVDGNFYGVTQTGAVMNSACGSGDGSCGTVFKVTPAGTLTILHQFCSQAACADGWDPSWLIRGGDGNFYGTTGSGGANHPKTCPSGCGTMFRITPTGTFTTLYNFCSLAGCPDGGSPYALVQASAGGVYGDFFGSTEFGGAFGFGTIFSITPQGQFTVLYNFCAEKPNCLDGFGSGPLTQDVGGIFYGVFAAGLNVKSCNSGQCSIFFRMTPAGAITVLKNFPEPIAMNGELVKGTDGFFYGTTFVSGNHPTPCLPQGCGTVFKVSTGGQYTTIYDFCSLANCSDGALPTAGLIQATDGNFYGSTVGGGIPGDGTLFTVSSSGTFTQLHNFCQQTNCTDGGAPVHKLTQGTDGKLYGMTVSGGSSVPNGTIYSLDMGLAPFVEFLVPTGNIGNTVGILGQGFTGTTAVSFNGTAATFTVKSDTFLTATVPTGATTGSVTVTTPSGTLTSNVAYRVTQ